jgi:hypothetical protein
VRSSSMGPPRPTVAVHPVATTPGRCSADGVVSLLGAPSVAGGALSDGAAAHSLA